MDTTGPHGPAFISSCLKCPWSMTRVHLVPHSSSSRVSPQRLRSCQLLGRRERRRPGSEAVGAELPAAVGHLGMSRSG